MLKCNIKKDGKISVKGSGSAKDLMAETGALIRELYRNIKRQSPEAAAGYKLHLIGLLLDPKSPVWKED